MKIILEVEDKDAALFEIAEILIMLRHYTKDWDEHFGSGPKMRKKYWEKKADEWLAARIVEDKEPEK